MLKTYLFIKTEFIYLLNLNINLLIFISLCSVWSILLTKLFTWGRMIENIYQKFKQLPSEFNLLGIYSELYQCVLLESEVILIFWKKNSLYYVCHHQNIIDNSLDITLFHTVDCPGLVFLAQKFRWTNFCHNVVPFMKHQVLQPHCS